MADKSGYVLDVDSFCDLAVQAKGVRDEVAQKVSTIKANISKLHGGDIDGLSGGQGDAINAALDNINQLCDGIMDHTNKIYIVADKKANAMSAAYKDHGGDDVLKRVEAENRRISKT